MWSLAESTPWGPVAVLAVVRLGSLLAAQASWRALIGTAWWWMSFVFAMVIAPVAVPELGNGGAAVSWPGWGAMLVAVVGEFAFGFGLGTAVSLPAYALIGAATGSASALRVASRPFVMLWVAVALLAGLGLGLHRPLLAALASLDAAYPLGRPIAWAAGLRVEALVRRLHEMVVLALGFATPVLLTTAIVDLALRILGRGPAPAEAVLDPLRVWGRFAIALLALGASWAAMPEVWGASAF